MSRILLAEDDRISRVMLQAVLMKWGYQVESVVDGKEALERMLDPEGPSLAILDWMMPQLTGLEVCRRLRKAAGLRPVHLILLTAKSKGTEAAEALGAGADDHLAKPYDLAQLQARIQLGIRRLEKPRETGSKIGGGQDVLLQRILSHFLPLNRMALGVVMENPGQLEIPAIQEGRCDLAKLVPEILSEASRFLEDRVEVSVDGAALDVGVSEATFRQILLNVLAHVRMASSDRVCRLEISWRDVAGGVLVRCEDDGPMVLPEDVALLGWPVTTIRNQSMNYGFGLFFANLVAESAGGSIACSNPAGLGLRTEIRLPGG